ncbi:MAG: tail fiber protein, partial [Hyphomicrobiaceae bacterium]
MAGAINMAGNAMLNLPAPTATTEPVRKTELDALSTQTEKEFNDTAGALSTSGSASAFTVTSTQTITSLADGIRISARMHATNAKDATLNLNSIGAKPIAFAVGQGIPQGMLQAGMPYDFVYDLPNTTWLVVGGYRGSSRFTAGDFKWSAVEADHGDWLLCDARALSRTTDAVLFAAIGTKFGVGDGSTTFNIPQQSNRALVGRDLNGTGAVVTNITTTNTQQTATLASITGIAIGMYVLASGIPAGTYITDINTTTSVITMSAAATATATVSGRFAVMTDPAVTGATGGSITHVQLLKEIASHYHNVYLNDPGHAHTFTYNGADT